MTPNSNSQLVMRFKSASARAGWVVLATGLAVLAGWTFDIPALKSVLPGLVTIKANTAAAFALVGVSLLLLQTPSLPLPAFARMSGPGGQRARRIAQASAALVALVGALTLAEYVFGLDLGIDQVLFTEEPGAAQTTFPGRMAANTALSFLSVGLALLMLDVETRRGRRPAQHTVFVAGALALMALVGYTYGLSSLQAGVESFTPMAAPTAVAFLVACAGVLCARPEQGVMALFTSPGPGGAIARWLILAAVGLPVVLEVLASGGQSAGLYDSRFESALHTVLLIVVFVAAVLAAARSLDRADAARRQAAETLQEAETRYRTLFEQSPDGVWIVDPEAGATIDFNEAAHRQLGYTREEFARLRISNIEAREDPEATKAHIEKVLREGRDDFETRHRTKEGEARDVLVTVQTTSDKGRMAFHAVVRDITERKRTEEALRRSERELAIRNRIAHVFLTMPDQEMFGEVLAVIREVLESPYGVFGYIDEKGALVVPSMTREVWDQCQVPEKDIVFPRDTWGDSIWCRAILEKRTLHSNHPSRVPEGHIPISRNISLPVVHQGEAIGLIQVANRDTDYGEEDVAFLERIADGIAPVLNARLQRDRHERARERTEAEIQRRNRELSVLHAISRATAQSLELEETLDNAMDATLQALQVEVGSILLMEPDGVSLALHVQRGLSEELREAAARIPVGEGMTGRVAAEKRQMIVDVADYPPGRLSPLIAREGYQTIAATPLLSAGEVVGVLNLATRRVRAFPPEERELLMAAGRILGGAVRNARMYEAVRQLNAERERRAAELDAVNKELEAFAYSVSHDLRAPLRAMDGFSRVLLEDFGSELGAEAQDALGRIRAATQRMGQLIDDLLKLSGVTRAELRLERVDLSEMARRIARELRRREPGREVEIVVADGAVVRADPQLLHVAVENLMTNAFKFTSGTPEARVEFGIAGDGAQPVYFVRDNGAGFDMAYADKLFGAFQRLHSASEFPGTGIGLATVQRIVHRHGGTVRAKGIVGGGATFSFTLQV